MEDEPAHDPFAFLRITLFSYMLAMPSCNATRIPLYNVCRRVTSLSEVQSRHAVSGHVEGDADDQQVFLMTSLINL